MHWLNVQTFLTTVSQIGFLCCAILQRTLLYSCCNRHSFTTFAIDTALKLLQYSMIDECCK